MELEEATRYIDFLYEEETNDLIFQRWVAGPQFHMSFESFKEKLKPVNLRKDEDIINDVFEIIESMGGAGLGNI